MTKDPGYPKVAVSKPRVGRVPVATTRNTIVELYTLQIIQTGNEPPNYPSHLWAVCPVADSQQMTGCFNHSVLF